MDENINVFLDPMTWCLVPVPEIPPPPPTDENAVPPASVVNRKTRNSKFRTPSQRNRNALSARQNRQRKKHAHERLNAAFNLLFKYRYERDTEFARCFDGVEACARDPGTYKEAVVAKILS
jgi:hypothetical protein